MSDLTSAAADHIAARGLPSRLREAEFAGDIALDAASRFAMSTDNSVYRIVPDLIVAPRDAGNPELRISDLAKAPGLTESWITRMLRLAFLDPAIVEQVLNGKAPSHLTLESLRSPESIPALRSVQRSHHCITILR